ncbi:glycosyltransferase family 2 protein [Prosthecomicrobium hirschii]|uniref:glycosyltransferase family 2 protein n=1 Tax=Prosthecodimorpha hirschii TaxID=665126 RepID=UPI00221E5DD2|nr:glycosyltransferase family 2 protein [Prosthecomicrobium hirschii]MCW1843769.1 glycosyltransferase family 2 protein [Prosthecomicrobium hirschii]
MPNISRFDRQIEFEKINVSVLILTRNEKVNIGACLDHLRWSDDVVVFDSLSTDETEEIAKKYGVRWIQRKFTNWSEHQNWAMENIPFKHEWVYYTDADERVPCELAEEILSKTSSASNDKVAYQVRRRDYYGESWIRRSTNYPLWFVRLFRPQAIRWSRKVNPVPTISGPIGNLENDFIHFPLSKGIGEWVDRHNSYSNFEAMELIKSLDSGDFRLGDLFSSDRVAQRHAMKKLSFRLPFRPVLRFFFLYFVKGGILDGTMGLRYCIMKAFYQYMIDIKVEEKLAKGGEAS